MRIRLTEAVTLTALLLLSVIPSSLSLGSSATLSIISATSTVCGIPSGDSPRSILCARPFTQNPARFPIFPNVSFLSLTGGASSLCALRPDSLTFLCWNSPALLPKRVHTGPDPLSDLSLGSAHIAAIVNNGKSIRFWRADRTFPVTVDGAYRSLTSGNGFTCAIRANDGRVRCWGGDGDRIQEAFANETMSTLVAGGSHACGENNAGLLVCKGSNSSGQLGGSPPGSAYEFSGLALGGEHTCAIRRANSTVLCWGGDGTAGGYSPIVNTSVELIVAGGNLTCGVTTENFSVVCWVADRRNSPVPVASLPKILPGVCIKSEERDSSCACGIVPGSEILCSGSGVICKNKNTCPNAPSPPPPPPPPPPSPGPSKKTSKWWWVFAIIGGVGALMGVCSILYCIWNGFCRQNKVYNSVQPTMAAAPGSGGSNAAGGSSSGAVPSPRVSPSGSKSRAYRRQGSRAVMNRQRSGTSAFNGAEQFTFSGLAAATKNFAMENKIGAGSFGTVYKGKLGDGREVAIKRSETSARTRRMQEKESAFQAELSFLSRLHHKHLVGLVGYCEEREERLLVYEYMKNGALYDHLHGEGAGESPVVRSWKMRIKVLLDAARGVEYLHSYAVPAIIHRDIKSSNILLDGEWVARVSDFGLSLLEPATGEEQVSMRAAGTVGYMDPEYYGLHHLTVKSDVYGLGVVMLEVLTGRRAIFKGEGAEGGGGSPVSVVDYAMPGIVKGEIGRVLDPRAGPPGAHEGEAVELVAYTAAHCVSLEGKERPSMTDIVSNLESALAMCEDSHGSISSASLSLGSYD